MARGGDGEGRGRLGVQPIGWVGGGLGKGQKGGEEVFLLGGGADESDGWCWLDG